MPGVAATAAAGGLLVCEKDGAVRRSNFRGGEGVGVGGGGDGGVVELAGEDGVNEGGIEGWEIEHQVVEVY
jgi:hypothetical protein